MEAVEPIVAPAIPAMTGISGMARLCLGELIVILVVLFD